MEHNNLKTQPDQPVALVAGATGFIGRYLILELLRQGVLLTVRAVSNRWSFRFA